MFNIAVVGCGNMSSAWITYVLTRKDSKIICLVDPMRSNAEQRNAEYHLDAAIYEDLNVALEKEDVNLVLNITPPKFHYSVVTTAMKHGCDVFGEKPMAASIEEGRKMIQCADETGRHYFVMQNRRYQPYICALKKFLDRRPLGEIGQISANFQLCPHFGGFRDQMDNPLIADMAIHTFDAARYLLGKEAVSVFCKEFNPGWSWYRGNANAVCIFDFEDGSVFDYRGSWCANGMQTSWESEWRIQCANGCLFWDGAENLCYQTSVYDAPTDDNIESELIPIVPEKLENEQHAGCLDEMFAALLSGVRPQTDCHNNIGSIEMVYGAIQSANENKVVRLSDAKADK